MGHMNESWLIQQSARRVAVRYICYITYSYDYDDCLYRLIKLSTTGWLRVVDFLKLYVSFAEYNLFYRALLQKRPMILRRLLIVVTPYPLPLHVSWFINICHDLFICVTCRMQQTVRWADELMRNICIYMWHTWVMLRMKESCHI